MAFCPNCGFEVPNGAAFCGNCGAQLATVVTQQPKQQYQQYQQPTYQQPTYQQPQQQYQQPYQSPYQQNAYAATGAYAGQPVQTDRSLIAYIAFTILTCGIYAWWFTYKLAQDMNTVCNDGDKTPGLAVYILLSMVTCGIYSYYWQYKIGNRQQLNAPAYGFTIQENGTTILLWDILGAFLCGIGPFVAMNIIIKNMNMLAGAYNARLAARAV